MNYWRGRRVFVTGGNGFVGAWLTKALVELEADVVVLARDQVAQGGLTLHDLWGKVSVVSGDVRDVLLLERVLNEYEIDTCFHLAAQTIVTIANRSGLSSFDSNIRGTWSLLEACRRSPLLRCVIVASSDKAYGIHEQLPYCEDFPLKAAYPYDVSKACCDMLARSYFHTYGLPVIVTRCANIFGGGDLNFSRIVPDTVRAILQDRRPVIRSDGTPLRDYLYVEDAVSAYLALAEHHGVVGVVGEAFNFGNGKPVSVLDLVRKLIILSGRTNLEPEVMGQAGSGEINQQYLCSEKAERLLGWHPRYSLDEGLAETLSWYERYFAGV